MEKKCFCCEKIITIKETTYNPQNSSKRKYSDDGLYIGNKWVCNECRDMIMSYNEIMSISLEELNE